MANNKLVKANPLKNVQPPNPLWRTVNQAIKEYNTWPEEKKRLVRLQGS